MKKLLLVFCLFSIVIAKAQNNNKLNLGIKVSPTLNWVESKTIHNVNNQLSPSITCGFIVEYYFLDEFAISSGINFNGITGNYHFGSAINPLGYLVQHGQIMNRRYRGFGFDFPVKVKIKLFLYGPWRIMADAGMAFSVTSVSRAKDDAFFPENPYYNQNFHDVGAQYRNNSKSLILSIGTEYALVQSTRLFCQITYYHGLNNIFSEKLENTTSYKYYPRHVGIEFGVMFR